MNIALLESEYKVGKFAGSEDPILPVIAYAPSVFLFEGLLK